MLIVGLQFGIAFCRCGGISSLHASEPNRSCGEVRQAVHEANILAVEPSGLIVSDNPNCAQRLTGLEKDRQNQGFDDRRLRVAKGLKAAAGIGKQLWRLALEG